MNSADDKRFKKAYVIMFWSGMVIASIIFTGLLLDYFKVISLKNLLYNFQLSTSNSGANKGKSENPDKIIARVGVESIFRRDFDIEASGYPNIKNLDTEKIIMQKLIKDSIILQAASSEKWIKLNRAVFNSPEKDYFKRVRLVKDVQAMYENRQNLVIGKVISIWFHNMVPAEIGYEEGKQVAFNKISSLHNDVKAGKISFLQAAQSITEDKELARVDKSYESNAILSFRSKQGDIITFDEDFNKIIRNLKVGEISDIYLAKDYNDEKKLIDAVYMFAQVDEITSDGTNQSFDQWLKSKEKNYEVQNF